MNYTAALTLSDWATEVQAYSQQVIRYTPIVFKAFNKTFTPIIIDSLKGISLYLIQRERLWYQWTMNVAGITHNPLQAAVRAAHAELISTEAQATYSHICHIIRETAMDALVIAICGVVAVAQGVEVVQKIYRMVKRVYDWVDARLNPAQPEPIILPSVELCFDQIKAEEEIAALIEAVTHERSFLKQLDRLDADALASVCAKVDDAIAQAKAPQPRDRIVETKAEESPVASYDQIWNPAPKDMHIEVQQMLQATAAPATAEAELVGSLDVPGATPKRTSRAKASTSKAGVKSKGARAKAKV
jgi:hypothetical protein